MDNAIKYTNAAGKIVITLKSIDNKIEFSVKDNGIGMDEGQKENIFKAFYQIEKQKGNRQGFGFGLFVVKNTVDSLGGEIEINSKSGIGTEFKIILNKYELKENDIVQETREVKQSYNNFKMELKPENVEKGKNTIFIVEDNIDVLYMMQDKLLDKYNVYYALNGKEALEKLLSPCPVPDLILSDIMMDTMDGIEFCKSIKSNEPFKDIPFIFLSAKSVVRLEGMEHVAVDFIEKPFNMPELLLKIDALIKLGNRQGIKINYDKMDAYDFKDIEKGIIPLLIEGLQNKDIADRLNKSENSIKKVLHEMYEKTNTWNRTSLINLFVK